MTSQNKKTTVASLDVLTGLRGIAAYAVLIAHAVDFAFQGRFQLYVLGLVYFGMSLFFVLSGFVICYNYIGILEDGIRTGSYRFFVARFARLYPLYIVMLAISLHLYPHEYFTGWPAIGLTAITLTQSWFNVHGVSGSIFGQSWSISTEWFFYLLFLFICTSIARLRRTEVALAVFLTLSFLGLLLLFNFKNEVSAIIDPVVYRGIPVNAPAWFWLTYFGPYLRSLEFVAGVIACRVYLTYQGKKISPNITRAGLFACSLWCVIAMVLTGNVQQGALMDMLQGFAYTPAHAPALILLCLSGSALKRLICSRPVLFMGEISYSVYVFQFFIFVMLSKSGWTIVSKNQDINAMTFIAGSIAAITVIGCASYWLFEKPMRKIIRILLLAPLKDRS